MNNQKQVLAMLLLLEAVIVTLISVSSNENIAVLLGFVAIILAIPTSFVAILAFYE